MRINKQKALLIRDDANAKHHAHSPQPKTFSKSFTCMISSSLQNRTVKEVPSSFEREDRGTAPQLNQQVACLDLNLASLVALAPQSVLSPSLPHHPMLQ